MNDAHMLETTNNADESRWEAHLGDQLVAFAEYRRTPDRVIFTHTVVEPEYEGRGVGSRLARAAIEGTLNEGLRITPYCPFIRAWLERHPEYGDWVDSKPKHS